MHSHSSGQFETHSCGLSFGALEGPVTHLHSLLQQTCYASPWILPSSHTGTVFALSRKSLNTVFNLGLAHVNKLGNKSLGVSVHQREVLSTAMVIIGLPVQSCQGTHTKDTP